MRSLMTISKQGQGIARQVPGPVNRAKSFHIRGSEKGGDRNGYRHNSNLTKNLKYLIPDRNNPRPIPV